MYSIRRTIFKFSYSNLNFEFGGNILLNTVIVYQIANSKVIAKEQYVYKYVLFRQTKYYINIIFGKQILLWAPTTVDLLPVELGKHD